MGNLAIIPARGGSKRIPKKNIKNFFGKPIIAYSIEVALNSGLFEEVMVSTDDVEIATIAKEYGANVPFIRSLDNSTDFATTLDVLKEVERNYSSLNKVFDFICCIYPTAPFIKVEHLQRGLDLLHAEKTDVIFPVVSYSYPIWRGLEIVPGNRTKMIWPEYLNSRSQDLKAVFHDAGQWYWYNPQKLNSSLFTDNTSSIVLNEDEVQDIDTMTDWRMAELKYKILREK